MLRDWGACGESRPRIAPHAAAVRPHLGKFMKPAFFLRIVLCLLLATPPAWAQDATPPPVGLDCWIAVQDAYYQTHYIFCIKDRTGLQSADPALDGLNELILDEVHYLVHEGSRDELERFVEANAPLLESGNLWRIRILSYPPEWSWQEERPQMLAEMLCPDNYGCPVFFRRW